MVVIDEIRRRAGQVAAPVMGALVIAYFAYHTVQGDRGLFTYIAMSQELARTRATLDTLQEQRRRLALRVASLRTDGLDRDLLEERARLLLDLVNPDEYIVLLPERAPDPAPK